jgi:hypothetical protein
MRHHEAHKGRRCGEGDMGQRAVLQRAQKPESDLGQGEGIRCQGECQRHQSA